MGRNGLVWIAVALAACILPGRPGEVSLTPVADTSLFEFLPDFNLGGQQDAPAGTLGPNVDILRSRLLLRFDLTSALPPDAIIRAASLRLTVTRVPEGGVMSRFGLHRVLKPWSEGTGNGSPPGGAEAEPGETTWNARAFPDQPWSQPGGEPGTDFVASPSSTERIHELGAHYFEFGPNQLLEIQQWLTDPETNFGWLLATQDESIAHSARRFATREHSNPEARPLLRIEYDLPEPVTPPEISDLFLDDDQVRIHFSGELGVRYVLETSDTLSHPSWQAVVTHTNTVGNGAIVLIDPSSFVPQRFYRITALR